MQQIFEYHPVIGYRFIPNLQTRVQHESGGYLVKTNAMGFRSEFEFEGAKNGASKRVLLFGDSYTAADGVSNKKRYSDILMQLLPNTEIYNFGMPGTGTDQQYLIYKEYAKDVQHDLIMIVVLVENIRRITAKYRFFYNDEKQKVLFQKPYFEVENDNLVLKNIPVNPAHISFEELSEADKKAIDVGGRFFAMREFINSTGLKDLVQKITKYQPLPEYRANGREWALMKTILSKWASESEKPVLLIPLPLHQYVEDQSDYSGIKERFGELGLNRNIHLFDPLGDLKAYSIDDRRKFRFEHDAHPSPFGHETYAKIFKPELEKLLTHDNG